MNRVSQQTGFTLLELLCALAVLAVLGTLSALTLGQSLNNEAQIENRVDELESLQQTHQALRRDLEQIVPRSGRDQFGDERIGTLISTLNMSDENTPVLEFFRTGRRMVGTQFPGSSLERVRYFLRGKSLIREASTALDPTSNSAWRSQVLMEQIEGLQLTFYQNQRWSSAWPIDSNSAHFLPTAIRILITHPKYGTVEQLILLPEANG